MPNTNRIPNCFKIAIDLISRNIRILGRHNAKIENDNW
jgi:hypothetical protein